MKKYIGKFGVFTTFLIVAVISFCLFTGFSMGNNFHLKIVGDNTDFTGNYHISAGTLNYVKKINVNALDSADIDYDKAIQNINKKLYDDISNIRKKEYTKAVDATLSYDINSDNPFVIGNGSDGRQVDIKRLYIDIIKCLQTQNASLTLNYSNIKPKITKNDILNRVSLRGQFETYYGSSSENRKHNIELAVSRLDNSVILPNQQFSFNKRVGKRGVENGYKEAPIIDDGKYVLGVGGGICQVSTTLYNAFLSAGLRIVESHPHSLPVGYVEPSFDAMVSSWSDMVVENVTNYPIFVKIKASGGILSVKVFGEKMDYSIIRKSVVKKVIPYETIYVKNGEEKLGKNGIESYSKLVYMQDGKVISERMVREDTYNPQSAVVIEKID